MIKKLIGNLPLTYIGINLPGCRKMALLKIAGSSCAFLVWDDTKAAFTTTIIELSGKIVHFVCTCSNCGFRRGGGEIEQRIVIRDKCKENGIETIFARVPDNNYSFSLTTPKCFDVHHGGGGWEQRIIELTKKEPD